MAKRFAIETIFKGRDLLTEPIRRMNVSVRRSVRLMSKDFERLSKKIANTGSGMRRIGKGITTRVSAPLGLLGGAVFMAGKNFDKFMNMVEAKSTVAGKSIEDLREKALTLGKTTSFSHIQAAEAMNFLAQAGFNTQQQFEAIDATLSLAQATTIELGQSADWLSNIMGGFQIEASSAGHVAAVLAQATAKANVSMEEIAETFEDVAPIAKQYGVSLEDAAAATGFLGNIGIKGSKAGTALKNMMLNLAAPTKKMSDALKSLGVETADSAGNMLDIKDVLVQLSGSLSKVSQQEGIAALDAIFGKRAIAASSGMLASLKKSNGQFVQLVDILNTSTAQDLDNMVKTMRRGSVGAFDDMMSAISGLGQAIADSGLMQFATDIIRGITSLTLKLAEASPWVLKLGVAFGFVLAALGPLVLAVGSAAPVFAALASSLSAVKVAAVAVASSIGVVTVSIGAVVGAIGVWVIWWDEIIEGFKIAWDLIKKIGSAMAKLEFGKALEIATTFASNDLTGEFDKITNDLDLGLVDSPQERVARNIEERRETSSAEVTIRDESGRAEVTSDSGVPGFNFQPSGAL